MPIWNFSNAIALLMIEYYFSSNYVNKAKDLILKLDKLNLKDENIGFYYKVLFNFSEKNYDNILNVMKESSSLKKFITSKFAESFFKFIRNRLLSSLSQKYSNELIVFF